MLFYIDLKNISYTTSDGRCLFDGIDLSVGSDRVGLVGPNGVGKTTMLNIIAGQIVPQTGTVHLRGRIGRLPQLLQIDPGHTVGGLLGFGAEFAILDRIS
jgi:ATPase subunit of ABC transporter with duplicated ATPase domains